MDTLAAARAAAGMRGLSINWGAWEGAGAAVDRDVTARAREAGYGVIDPRRRLPGAGSRAKSWPIPSDRFPGGLAPVSAAYLT